MLFTLSTCVFFPYLCYHGCFSFLFVFNFCFLKLRDEYSKIFLQSLIHKNMSPSPILPCVLSYRPKVNTQLLSTFLVIIIFFIFASRSEEHFKKLNSCFNFIYYIDLPLWTTIFNFLSPLPSPLTFFIYSSYRMLLLC